MALVVVIVLLVCLVVENEGTSFLLFATRRDIRLMDIESGRFNASAIVVRNLEDAAALDFCYAEEAIFWTDINLEMIKGVYMNGSKAVDIVSSGLMSPDGLACDWLGRKLYWTDSETNRIEVSNLDGSYRKVLFWKDLDQPRAISLVPMEGIIFWTDWGEVPKIEKAGMDGDPTTRKVIVNKELFWPNGLTIDYEARRVYWSDAKLKRISSVDFNGNHRQVAAINKLEYPFALTLYGDVIYWTDWSDKSINSFNKRTGQQKHMVVEGYLSPTDIHVYAPQRQPKGSTPCDDNNGGCSHLCLMSSKKPYYSCACPTGVKLLRDGKNCAQGAQKLLLLVRRIDLRRISLDTPDHTDVVLELKGIRHALAIDYDPVEKQVYWTDDEVRVIRRANLDGTNQENLVATEVGQPDGIAIDWIARNMYWTDTGTDRIEVARLNGTSRKILIRDKLEEPRAIVVDPSAGYMYWTDWGSHPKIERATLDGQDRIELINTSLGWPNGLAIDYTESKLYWGDAKADKIEVSNLDGSDRRVLVSDQLPHIFGFTLLDDFVYWTDWQRRSIERVHKVTGGQREVIIDQLPDVMGLKAVDVNEIHASSGTSPCAIRNGDCSHLCLNRPDKYVCSCPMGLELMPDLKTCIVPEAFLLFSRRADIRRISLESNHDDIIPVSGVEEAIALDYDINDNRIYWTDTKRKTISRAFMNGSNTEHVVQFGLEYPEGMAVDWVAHNLYWADMGLNRIEVARLDGTSRRVLLWKDLEDPRSLALDPSEGYMYWSDWGTRRIEKASMDGSHRIILIGKIGRANGLTIDYLDRRLFWTDIDGHVIESSDLQGNHRIQVISEGLPNPYGLTQYQDYIYWTDWTTKSIERANKTTGGNRTVIQGQLDYVVDILVFHTSRQSGWNPCAVNNGGCSHLCLALPGSSHKSFTHQCACPTHYALAPDNKTCSSPENFLLFSQKNAISRILVDTNNSPDIVLPIHNLRNVKSINYDPVDHFVYWVDGRTRTIRRSYDNGTKVSVVIMNPGDIFHPYDIAIDPFSRLLYWTCAQSNTINVTRLDGRAVGIVIGGSEERPRSIALHPYKGLMFWTNTVSPPRIERAAMDGLQREVLFTSNLQQPGAIAVDVRANLLFWTDVGLKQIETSTITGENRKVLVDSNLHQPLSVTVYEQHLYWIDQDQQVIERINKLTGGDRQRVLGRVSQISDLIAITGIDMQYLEGHSCIANNGGCSHLCLLDLDGKRRCSCPMDLILGGDDKTCISPPTCPSDHFSCLTGKTNCIPEAWRCDGIPECEDKSDEMNCPECKPPRFRCSNGICLDPKSACEDIIHCSDDISEHCCASDEFMCQTSRQCIKKTLMCNNKQDCVDGSDEKSSNCDGVVGRRVVWENDSTKANYAIGISVAVALLILIAIILYVCRCKARGFEDTEDVGDEMMAAKPLNPQPNSTNNGNSLPKAAIVSTRNSNASACLSLPQSSSGQLYDRNHVTGASSSSSSGTPYPQETMNPPPTPVTVYSSQRMYRHRCSSYAPSTLASYRHYHSRNRPPPPTPCSTDVCDDSEPSVYRQRYYNSQTELSYDSDPYPPPPTPRSQCLSDEHFDSCPPSPSTERSYYSRHHPYPPPPSPVPECDT